MNKLDGVVLNVELTLISIIQGVTLYFLVESSRHILIEKQFAFWPYVATGLIVLFLFWSRSIMHALTVIHWPMDFGHTFIYIAAAFIQALAFTQANHPSAWFGLNSVLALFIWILFAWDLRLIDSAKTRSPETQVLLHKVREEQWRNIRMILPFSFFFNLSAFVLITTYPHFFIDRNGHLFLIGLQFMAGTTYLLAGIFFFKRLLPHFRDSENQ